jgi:hypothetical protein
MLRLDRVIKPWKESAALNAHINLFGFWNETAFLTKSGDLGMVLRISGIDYESLDNYEQDYAVVLPATTKAILTNINRTDSHTHNLICDNLTVDTMAGMNVTPASTSRRQPSRSNSGVNRIASRGVEASPVASEVSSASEKSLTMRVQSTTYQFEPCRNRQRYACEQ